MGLGPSLPSIDESSKGAAGGSAAVEPVVTEWLEILAQTRERPLKKASGGQGLDLSDTRLTDEVVEALVEGPHGRFLEDEGGRFMESCVKCEPGRFNVNVGSASKFDCLRCPPGRFANEPGMKQCKCMNQYDGYFEVNLNNTRVYGPCQPETHLDTVIRPRIVTIDWAPRTTYP